ncbi:activating signal cointegrator 1 isoform X1 [Brachyhypopomus gauderio]|uniref:activating signal cointegrator 1 isoform X1 n=1 Tax=Brachyhypopomus gauderio TaxID=698409 RepID=UPI0040414960
MSDPLLRWCVDELNSKFGLEASDDIVQYVLSINNAEEIAEYVGDLLQGTDGKKKQFINELVRRWRGRALADNGPELIPMKETVTEGPDVPKDTQKKSKRKGRNKQEVVSVSQVEPEEEAVKTPIDLLKAQESTSSSSTKKKNKFVNLYAKEGQDRLSVVLPGRHSCDCLAQRHKLINNCMTCGRIVCEQEGSGPCFFCGSLVCTKEEQEILQRDSNRSQKLRKKLMGDRTTSEGSDKDYLPHQEARIKAGLEKAVQHKDKLLEYDKSGVRRTQVLDDESDYFASDTNQWLSPGERETIRKREAELRELRHTSRKDRKITLDFAGRQVLEEDENLAQYYNKFDETVKAINSGTLLQTQKISVPAGRQHLRELVNPNIVQLAPQWVDVGGGETSSRPRAKASDGKAGGERARLRLQDRELLEMADGGWCLSMHQPWASLLTRGIKRVEGRTWYTSHRGRLWIAAAAKRPSPQEIAQVEATYRQIYKQDLQFPEEYPTGCLLGCVNMTDCLSQEQFREQHPGISEESASPFVFICTNPQELLVKFPMKGKHKICKSCSFLFRLMTSAVLHLCPRGMILLLHTHTHTHTAPDPRQTCIPVLFTSESFMRKWKMVLQASPGGSGEVFAAVFSRCVETTANGSGSSFALHLLNRRAHNTCPLLKHRSVNPLPCSTDCYHHSSAIHTGIFSGKTAASVSQVHHGTHDN